MNLPGIENTSAENNAGFSVFANHNFLKRQNRVYFKTTFSDIFVYNHGADIYPLVYCMIKIENFENNI